MIPFHGDFKHFLHHGTEQQGEEANPAVSRSFLPPWGSWSLVDPDKGQHFREEVITTVLRGAGIKQKIQSLYLPQSPGQGEHMNKTIKGALWTVAGSNDRD